MIIIHYSTDSLFQFKRQEQPLNNAGDIDNATVNNSNSFKYKYSLLKGLGTKNVGENIDLNIANAHRLYLNAQLF